MPDDVALVGFDNWDVMALACQPPLTSVDMGLEELGRTAADLLLAAINGEAAPGRHISPCRLVVRDSTAVPVGPVSGGGVPRRPTPGLTERSV
ncbi:substrate-binding domain-containing protein [Actinosynnema sp. NPDC023658]|uniref:substrate-binding domain-containing protein n=1 Tax=Actinosynnema sp. NPDC023658 TaxID=3155465 RepID=UPI0033D53367